MAIVSTELGTIIKINTVIVRELSFWDEFELELSLWGSWASKITRVEFESSEFVSKV